MGVLETYLMERRILGEGTGMEESGKEISMGEYPVGRGQDNRTAAVADSVCECLLLEWMVEYSVYGRRPSTIRIGAQANSARLRSQ